MDKNGYHVHNPSNKEVIVTGITYEEANRIVTLHNAGIKQVSIF